MAKVTKERIDSFLSGSDPMERIVKIECGYGDNKVSVIYNNENGRKKILYEDFYPFVWAKKSAARELFCGDRNKLKYNMSKYNIGVKALRMNHDDGRIPERMENGYNLLFFAKSPMSYSSFMKFFNDGGVPIYGNKNNYIAVAPNEQYMIYTGRRLFKGYDDYNDTLRVSWDIETEGLDPEKCSISQIGIRTNKNFEKIISIDGEGDVKFDNEIKGIDEFIKTLKEINPDIITGYNTENFDWVFNDVRLKKHGSSLDKFSRNYFPKGIYKKNKQSVLKLGGEMEYYYPTIMWGRNLTDALFSVRRAQALDSNMKRADLKYITRYSELNKPNRVYVPGKIINDTWADEINEYAFNDVDGTWFKINDKILDKKYIDSNDGSPKNVFSYETISDKRKLINNEKNIEYDIVTGRYIVQRYLLDDLYETDKVELRYNQPNFLVGKMLPVQFDRMCTMGTAAIWKYIMMSWSFENNLAIPDYISRRKFTGGLSRLLSVGYIDRVVKLDYNSLYPSIMLSMGIKSDIDITGVMLSLLEYILTQREYYKGLKGKAGKEVKRLKKILKDFNGSETELTELKLKLHEAEEAESRNDKMQLPLKITGNAFFGSYGSGGGVFPWSDMDCAEETTCSGRMMLRLMIYWFTNLGYKPIVGDSFTGDTPLFVKYDNNDFIDIKPISEIIDEKSINKDAIGREYDYSKKGYKVLCRSGWVEPTYVYRHKTDKKMYRVTDNEAKVDVTQDHSLFDSSKKKIKPSEIKKTTKLEYYNGNIDSHVLNLSKSEIDTIIDSLISHDLNKIPVELLNSTIECKSYFYNKVKDKIDFNSYNKTIIAGIQFIKKHVKK